MVTEQDVLNRWNEIQSDSEKILFIVGGPGSGKSSIIRSLASDQKWEYIEAKELLSEELLEVARDQRPEVVRQMILENLMSYLKKKCYMKEKEFWKKVFQGIKTEVVVLHVIKYVKYVWMYVRTEQMF